MRGTKCGKRRRRLAVGWVALSLVAGTVAASVPASPAAAAPGDVTTIAGTGIPGPPGDGGPATSASLLAPWGLKKVGDTLYISEEGRNRVRKIVNGVITSFAGGGTAPLGDGLKATQGSFNLLQGVSFDAAGNMYIADTANNRIRRVDVVTRVMATVAGNGTACSGPTLPCGDGGPASSAQLNGPLRVVPDAAGNIFISDSNDNRIRRVDATTHVITTVAGTGSSASSGDGGPATAAGFSPRGIAFDPAGNLYIADVSAGTVRKVVPGPDGLVNGGPGEIITTYVGGGTLLLGPATEGNPATAFSLVDSNAFPEGIVFDASGNLYVSLVGSPRVIRVAAGDHALTTVAGNGTPARLGSSGDGGPATAAQLTFPFGVAVDPAGNLYIADINDSRVRRVDATTHIITTVAGLGQAGAIGAFGSYGDGGPGAAAPVGEPADVAFSKGSVFFVDRRTNRVRRIDANGIITTYAGGGVNDGGPATNTVLDHPRGLDADAAGNLYIADCGNARVRKVTPAGMISTVAGGGDRLDVGPATSVALGCPSDVAVVKTGPDAGSIYIADTADNRIRKVTPAGIISTVVGTGTPGFAGDGGAATAAQLNRPQGVSLAANGDLLVADTGNNRVRRVDHLSGRITTIAGNGAFGPGSDGVPATSTTVVGPTDAIADTAGNIFIAEAGFNRIRKVDPAGIITTVAGTGIPGFGGDGGPARGATLATPTQLELDAGSLLFTDRDNGRVRRIAAGSSPPPPAMGCGAVLTKNTTLTTDVGPCPGDGLVIGADNITLNLNGHTVSGTGPGDGSNAGVRIANHKGVTITGGLASTVRGFSDGVAIIGGSNNTVSTISIRDNVGPPTTDAVFGDGIGVFFSAGNTLSRNLIVHNGIYTGIAILGPGSSDNTIQGNTIRDTVDTSQGQLSNGTGIVINAFLSTEFPRMVSVFRNKVIGNVVENSDNSGISNISNVNGMLSQNIVRGNGRRDGEFPRNGLGVQHLDFAQPDTHVLVDANIVTNNHGGDGIHVASEQNTLRNNQVHGNDSGILVTGQGHLNQILNNNAANNAPDLFSRADLEDDNFTFVPFFQFDCDQNTWRGNVWGTGGFFPDCTATGGHPAPGGPPPPAPGAQAGAQAGVRGERQPPPPPSLDGALKRGFPPRP